MLWPKIEKRWLRPMRNYLLSAEWARKGREKAEGMRRRRSGQKRSRRGETNRECHVDILAKGLAKMGDGKANQKIRNSTNGIVNSLDCFDHVSRD